MLAACFSEAADPTAGPSGVECRIPLDSRVIGSERVLVAIRNFTFRPDTLRITPGTTVTWVNCESERTATFTVSADGTSVDYVLSVSGMTGATASHIHTGGADEAGGVLVGLFSSDPPTGDVNGTLESGTFTGADYEGDLEDLLELMRSGEVYVNVHTEAHPAGEIRGQIMPSN